MQGHNTVRSGVDAALISIFDFFLAQSARGIYIYIQPQFTAESPRFKIIKALQSNSLHAHERFPNGWLTELFGNPLHAAPITLLRFQQFITSLSPNSFLGTILDSSRQGTTSVHQCGHCFHQTLGINRSRFQSCSWSATENREYSLRPSPFATEYLISPVRSLCAGNLGCRRRRFHDFLLFPPSGIDKWCFVDTAVIY